jgi:hypothetical protein
MAPPECVSDFIEIITALKGSVRLKIWKTRAVYSVFFSREACIPHIADFLNGFKNRHIWLFRKTQMQTLVGFT